MPLLSWPTSLFTTPPLSTITRTEDGGSALVGSTSYVFPDSREVLKANEGSLAQTPLPLLLRALQENERTCSLELRLRNLEKRVTFEDGAPVDCSSNLLHETLGKYLVGKGKLTEAQYHSLLSESAAENKSLAALLVHRQLIAPFELFRTLQVNLAHKILDVFRWGDARWKLFPPDEVHTPIKINGAQLVLTGCGQLPEEMVARHLPLTDESRVALTSEEAATQGDLKLSPKDLRLLQKLKGRPTVAELITHAGLDRLALLRRLFALFVLKRIDLAENIAPNAAPAPVPSPAPFSPSPAQPAPSPAAPAPSPTAAVAPIPPSPPPGLPFLDDDAAARDALTQEFLSHRERDVFDLLGVTVDANVATLQKAYLAKAQALAPVRFKTAELRQRAEAIALAYARAFGALVEPDAAKMHRTRREVAEEARKAPKRPTAAEQFKIQTNLLDAGTQFEEGKARLNAGNFRGAAEHFEFACDIEPKGTYQAYLAWAKFRAEPDRGAKAALAQLAEVCESESECEEAWAFRGDLAHALGQAQLADECYRRAYKINPQQKRYADALRDLARSRKS